MRTISNYRNIQTGELAPPHRIAETEEGIPIYQFTEGWEPADKDGNVIECERDEDGNWWVDPESSI